MLYSLEGKKVFVAGHKGMVGAAVVRRLQSEECDVITADRAGLDLTRQDAVERWMAGHKPDAVFLAAAKVGGIYANNTYRADFIYQNLAIQNNVIHAAYLNGVEKLLFLGSSCIYPRNAPQPIAEDALLTGPLEPTNEPYAIAKIAGIKMCESYRRQYGCDFISVMPTNLYGPGDNYDPDSAHVPAAFLRRFHEARKEGLDRVDIWGSGKPLREFLHVDDLADACVFLMQHHSDEAFINVGSGREISIQDFAHLVARTVGFKGEIGNDLSRPDGTPRKLLDCTKLRNLGWTPRIDLETGLREVYRNTFS